MKQRLEKLRKRIEQYELDAFLVSSLSNIRYLFGFTGSNAIALITSDLSFFITDRRYDQQASEQVVNAEIKIAKKDLLSVLKEINPLRNEAKLGIEAIHLKVSEYFQLKKILPNIKLIPSERIVEKISNVKDADEVVHIKAAANICKKVFAEIISLIKPGLSEIEISAEISYRTKLQGSEKDPFEPIVASGLRSALPHGISSSKKLQVGDLVIIDFGAIRNGYAADFTRTVVLGKLSSKQKEMAAVVEDALEQAEAAAKPGIIGKELDRVARDSMYRRGYKKYFQHSLGHGIGLDVHGLPRIGEFSNDLLEIGNVITLEPGVYLPEFGGVRIEDDFVVTKNGVENLTEFSREVMCVG